jgi:hypothetical protein
VAAVVPVAVVATVAAAVVATAAATGKRALRRMAGTISASAARSAPEMSGFCLFDIIRV